MGNIGSAAGHELPARRLGADGATTQLLFARAWGGAARLPPACAHARAATTQPLCAQPGWPICMAALPLSVETSAATSSGLRVWATRLTSSGSRHAEERTACLEAR